MSQYRDTNPHFWHQQQPDFPGPYQHLEPEAAQPWESHSDQIPRQAGRIQTRTRRQPSRSPPPPLRPRHHQPSRSPPPPVHPRHQQPQSPPPPVHPRHRQHQPPLEVHPLPSTPPEHASQPHQTPPTHQQHSPHSHPAKPHPQPKPHHHTKRQPHQQHPHHVSFEEQRGQGPPPPHGHLMYPTPSKTKPITWFGAVFCVILWLVIILGGLLVLIIYLVYRPQTPHFKVSSATLNAVYLDMGYLLNADLTILANFTNPNRKVNVDFSYVTLRLYFDKLLIANHYIGPFSAINTESKVVSVEFVSSQVRLPPTVTQQLVTQIQRNRVMFEVDGIFHARSNFGSLLRYSYWLYGRCGIEMTGPPTGVMIASKCRKG